MNIKKLPPGEIERESFRIITEELGGKMLAAEHEMIIKRVIHTSADFEYADTLEFSPGVVKIIGDALKNGANIVTDTNMARVGTNEKALRDLGAKIHCFMSDGDIAAKAKSERVTRAAVCMEKGAKLDKPLIFVIGNAPTALIKLCEMYKDGQISPAAVIGLPVGFVNVIEAKEMLIESGIPYITARGRKGGSNVAAAVMNAIMYELSPREAVL